MVVKIRRVELYSTGSRSMFPNLGENYELKFEGDIDVELNVGNFNATSSCKLEHISQPLVNELIEIIEKIEVELNK